MAIDARGFGDSDPVTTPESLSPETSSDDVASVMDALGVRSAALCGFSLGAATAARFAVDRPERVDALVLGGLALGPLVQAGLTLGRGAEEARQQALEQLARVHHDSPREAAYFGAARSVISATSLRDLATADLRAPVLGVAGDQDPHDPFALYEHLRGAGAQIRIERIAGVGHGACFAHAEFRRTALEFLVASRKEHE